MVVKRQEGSSHSHPLRTLQIISTKPKTLGLDRHKMTIKFSRISFQSTPALSQAKRPFSPASQQHQDQVSWLWLLFSQPVWNSVSGMKKTFQQEGQLFFSSQNVRPLLLFSVTKLGRELFDLLWSVKEQEDLSKSMPNPLFHFLYF